MANQKYFSAWFVFSLMSCIEIGQPAYADGFCESLLIQGLERDHTEGLIAYLGALLENKIIDDSELFRLGHALEDGILENPITIEQASVSSAARVHRDEVQKYIDDAKTDPGRLQDWLQDTLRRRAEVRVSRDETKEETIEPYD